MLNSAPVSGMHLISDIQERKTEHVKFLLQCFPFVLFILFPLLSQMCSAVLSLPVPAVWVEGNQSQQDLLL